MNFDPHFKSLQEDRTDINIQYELLGIVFLTLVAILCGAEGWKDCPVVPSNWTYMA